MAKISPYETGELTDSIFLILLTTIKPIHGYRIMQEIQKMTKGVLEIGPATMYTTLKKLKDANWINEISEDESKILYRISETGKIVLEKNFTYRKELIKIATMQLKGE